MNLRIIIEKFKKQLMLNGKKSTATKILDQTLSIISKKGYSPSKVLVGAILNVKPLVAVKQVKIRGNLFTVPFPKTLGQQLNSGIGLILTTSKKKGGNLPYALADELIASYEGQSISVKETENLHKLAVQNKLFSTYRWF